MSQTTDAPAPLRDVVIERAGAEDTVSLLKLLKKYCDEDHPDYPPMMDKSALHWIVDTICSGYVCNASMNGRLIASVGFSIKPYPWNAIREYMSLEWLYILPAFRKYPEIGENILDKVKKSAYSNHIDIHPQGFFNVGNTR